MIVGGVTVHVCSLIDTKRQVVPVSSTDYYLVRFPYGSKEAYDGQAMHQAAQPDGVTSSYPDARSALIWPSRDGWGMLSAMVFWEAASASEYRARFIRDPLGLSTGYDSTATTDYPATPGGQYRTYHWQMFVHVGTPVAFAVRHNGSSPVGITLAEFKLAIL